VIHEHAEGAHRQRVRVTPQHRDGFLDVLGTVAVHHCADAVFQFPDAVAHVQHDGVATAAQHRGLEGSAGTQRGIEEHHPQELAGKMGARARLLPGQGLIQHRGDPVDAQIRDVGEVFHGWKSRMAASRASTAAVEMVSGGIKRSTAGSEEPPTRMPCSCSFFLSAAAWPPALRPKSSPSPRTSVTTLPASPARMRAAWAVALIIRPSSWITCSVASNAAHARGPPPKVLPRSPDLSERAISAVMSKAPMGTPEAIPLASVMKSGSTP